MMGSAETDRGESLEFLLKKEAKVKVCRALRHKVWCEMSLLPGLTGGVGDCTFSVPVT